MTYLNRLENQSQMFILSVGAVLIALIGLVDYITGSELSFSVFYLIPIAIMAWMIADTRLAVAASVVAALVWLLSDLAGDRTYSSNAFPFWNAGVRLSFFLIVTFTLASLRDARSRQADLANFIVHDLRSPLSNIVTGMKYLLEYSEEDLQPEQRDVIEIGLASSVWMMSLVNSLLDLAKLESGQLKPHLQPTDVAAMFDSALENISAMAMNNDVEIVTQIDADAERALADSELVVRILVNLVSNALKYSPQKATVTIRAFASDSDKVALSVTDQGAGIPKKWVKNVFNKFAQVEARGTGIAVGSGLGLTFCKMAVEAHGGRIWLESELGQGTTIYFTLPKAT